MQACCGGGGIVPFSLVDASTGCIAAQAGVDLGAMTTAAQDLESAELPLEDADGIVIAVLTLSIAAHAALEQLHSRCPNSDPVLRTNCS